ncbi:hypothetical protein Zmor_007101 [Zophobas morio]|uniref:Uncharacterized protein n=1 Tax=Zophobas morio TaxID=2755281 RepID=A0AA38IYY3_9CUCU|nr:hypothetical protein Zmor_007101 [Zophobas morio]
MCGRHNTSTIAGVLRLTYALAGRNITPVRSSGTSYSYSYRTSLSQVTRQLHFLSESESSSSVYVRLLRQSSVLGHGMLFSGPSVHAHCCVSSVRPAAAVRWVFRKSNADHFCSAFNWLTGILPNRPQI